MKKKLLNLLMPTLLLSSVFSNGQVLNSDNPQFFNNTGSLTKSMLSGQDSLMDIPAHTGNFSSNVRGYYFQAPVDFVITALRVPTDASSSHQNVEVVRFNSGPPPLFSGTTNAFTSLGRWDSIVADTIYTSIAVSSGDYIGIYGNRDNVSSYGPSNYSTSIFGLPTTLIRSGMQFSFTNNPMQDIFSEATGSIARTEMYYSSAVVNCANTTYSGTTLPCGGGSSTITSNGLITQWFSDDLGTNTISTNDTLVTPVLSSDTTFYAENICPNGPDSAIGLPAHTSTFTGNVRGYYFQAPTDFVITKLRVPTDANSMAQTVEVLNFGSTPPPLWSGTTNAFTSEGRWDGVTADTIFTSILVRSGDYIGIYGNRNDQNSYGASHLTSIDGMPITLIRTGMQQTISNNPMANVFSEASGSIARTEMYYTTNFDTIISAVNVTVPQASPVTNATASICMGDSALLGGVFQTTAGTYVDSLQNVNGCDSLISTVLSVFPISNINVTADICAGDSIFLGGSFQTTAGTYTDLLQTVAGCDSNVTTTLTVNTLPTVSIAAFNPDTICDNGAPVTLPVGTPTTGTYSGSGVSGTTFDPSLVGTGTYSVVYSYTDGNGCMNSDSTSVFVDVCVGIQESDLASGIVIYPTPTKDILTIQVNEKDHEKLNLTLVDVTGKTVKAFVIPENHKSIRLNISDLTKGIYFLVLPNTNVYKVTKL